MNNPTANSLLQLQTIPPTNQPPKWKPPSHPSQKLNVDAAYLCDTQCFGIGFILRDSHGSFLAVGTRTQLCHFSGGCRMQRYPHGHTMGLSQTDLTSRDRDRCPCYSYILGESAL
ncbi:hypothetical protein IFM89_024523 [Coptis chinensis]|uniref:Uncharacterized protein n=1 Tax=Coptis chinensis TaxID=261450 RepID=A0A835HPI1_9MAGN|nr:hypothetical protein IFM89_024523 [Coptis chinensis]